ncbi:MAG: NPCBM/NEW2 domain-containing protein, partial [Lentisphaeria bacterium]|nr:NPCBM/NEW2 domain-containing protein [Lentisphaeria bacterium]
PRAERVYLALTEKLRRGFYSLRIDGLGERTFKADIMVPDRKRYFGKDVMARLADLRSLNSDLGFLQRRVNLDWDSAEPVPNLSLHDWFRKYAARNSETNAYEVVPVVGYSADWAGPEKELAVAAGTYRRDVGSYMQAPVRMADWTIFTRNVGREHAKEFKTWVFWQGPDMKESPVHLPQQKYQQMFGIFKRWISLYNPDARVVAGGFTYDRVLGYLNNMKEPHKLPFDHFEIRVNPGTASVEALQLEDFLEDLGTMLKLAETGRKAAITELDWATGEQITLLEQAAYHARAAILLHARGALPHRFGSVNSNRSRDGFGVLFQPRFGNSFTQPPRNIYIPKPAYFALLETRRALAELAFKQRVTIAERDPLANRAYLFKRKDGGVCAIVWSVRDTKTYQLPAAWANSVKASDVFGTAVDLKKTLPVGSVPLFLNFTSVPMDRVAYDLRNLRPVTTEGTHQLVLDFFSAEAASRKAVEFTAKGGEKTVHKTGRLFFGERVSDGFLKDVREERFVFTLAKPADVLMSRLWFLAKGKRTLKVSLNGAAPQAWDLAPSKEYPNPDEIYLPGPRRTAFVLRGCRSGRNELALFHDGPSMSGGFRLTVIKNGKVDLTACGALAYKDSGAPARAFKNASGGPLKLGKTVYSSGIGCLGATTMEYALNGQYSRFEVTVGIDASTRGRGTVGFRILVDGVEKAKSGPTTGMSRAKKLEVKDLAKAKRLLLIVDDGGDGAENDMANWVDPILYLKEKK